MNVQEMRKHLREQSPAPQSAVPARQAMLAPAKIEFPRNTPTSADEITPSHSGTRGLFGHIQANNFKSIIVFTVFRLLDELSGWIRCFWVVGFLLNPVGRAFPVDVTGGGQGRAL